MAGIKAVSLNTKYHSLVIHCNININMAYQQIIFALIMVGVTTSSAAQYYLGKEVKPHLYDVDNVKDYEDNEPSYKYAYQVSDQQTGDFKNHHETREGDVVKGYYSVQEADGTLREVHYTSDKVNGFNAVVKKSGTPTPEPEIIVNNNKFENHQYAPQDYRKPNLLQKRQSVHIPQHLPVSEDYRQSQQPISVYSLLEN